MRKVIFTSIFLFVSTFLFSQELFPNNEPASSIPKGVLGIREFNESFKEISIYRNLFSLKLMYGLFSKLSISASGTVTNHHGLDFPPGLASHTHPASGSPVYSTGNFQRGIVYPYLFTGVYLYAKYRFLSLDQEHAHFRMAVYGEGSNVNVAHDEAEPTLMDDTKGYGGGLIATYLKYHFAVSLTAGVIMPGTYRGFSPDTFGHPSVIPQVPTEVKYGKAIKYNLSFGYLLFPRKYENYNQMNWNIYLEFMGKTYGEAKVIQYGDKLVPISTPLLEAGNYVDICPGIQTIIKSNLRVDFSVQFPLVNKAYTHFYPMYMFGIQRYFFFHKKSV